MTFILQHIQTICTRTVRVRVGVLLFECCCDEEGVRLGVFMLPNLNADLWDADANLVQEPQQSVVIDRIWREKHPLFGFLTANLFIIHSRTAASLLAGSFTIFFFICSLFLYAFCMHVCQRLELLS